RVVLDRHVVGEGRVVDQHVDRAVPLTRLADQPLALRRLRDVGPDRVGLAARLADGAHRLLERAREGMLTFLDGAGRADDAASLGGEEPGDVGADAATGAGDYHDLAVESAHECLRAAIVHDGAARSTRAGPGRPVARRAG